MRKGADCLSKWVGEAERQLRLLFDEAYKNQPAIIFFDEIDGLAPVRSSRQDQIHSSIVSTLLALMDGLDNRGSIIVIGATNRPDAIDPALRRPGRFDRELQFTLPNRDARKEILKIHTKHWKKGMLNDELLDYLADESVGYCGADLEALCRESFLSAIRRTYPQIYYSNVRLEIDTQLLTIGKEDFEKAFEDITPSSQRSSLVYARAIPKILEPLLMQRLINVKNDIKNVFKLKKNGSWKKLANYKNGFVDHGYDNKDNNGNSNSNSNSSNSSGNSSSNSSDNSNINIVEVNDKEKDKDNIDNNDSNENSNNISNRKNTKNSFHYRYLICGENIHCGQVYLGSAVLHLLEEYPMYSLDLPSLYGDSTYVLLFLCWKCFSFGLKHRKISKIIFNIRGFVLFFFDIFLGQNRQKRRVYGHLKKHDVMYLV